MGWKRTVGDGFWMGSKLNLPWGNGYPGFQLVKTGLFSGKIVTWPRQEMSRWRSCRTCRFRWILPPPFACKKNMLQLKGRLHFHYIVPCSFIMFIHVLSNTTAHWRISFSLIFPTWLTPLAKGVCCSAGFYLLESCSFARTWPLGVSKVSPILMKSMSTYFNPFILLIPSGKLT